MKKISIALLVLIISSCSTHKSLAEKSQTDNKIIQKEVTQKGEWIAYEKGYCFGTCPVFSIIIFNDGSVLYEGKANVKNIGKYTAQLSEEEMAKLRKDVDEKKIMSLEEDQVNKLLMDVTVIRFKLTTSKDVRLISHSGPKPEDLIEIENAIEALIPTLTLKEIAK